MSFHAEIEQKSEDEGLFGRLLDGSHDCNRLSTSEWID